MAFDHVPVMVSRIVELLAPPLAEREGQPPVLVDATLGLGGHSAALLAACPAARLVGIDRDEAARTEAAHRLAGFAARVSVVGATYDAIPQVLRDLGHASADAILIDAGLSSLQIDDASRGFSYTRDAALDMRMDQTSETTAAELVNTLPAEELTRILRTLGDERHAGRIARAIVAERRTRALETTAQLVALIDAAVPAAAHRSPGHAAKRTFQALRIAVNDELRLLADALPAAISSLALGGRLAVLSYHSGEDRLVKRAMVAGATDTTPPGLPIPLTSGRPTLRLLTRGAERPGPDEVRANPRAASARLRAVERIAADPTSTTRSQSRADRETRDDADPARRSLR
jgi:16S rRNA (cytosine1402-N4)-methyltransferase